MKNFIKKFGLLVIAGLIVATTVSAVTIYTPQQGGTGIGSVSAGDIGKVLTVSNNSPFTYSISTVSGGHIIQDEGSSLTQRAKLNFVGAGVTATDGGAGPDSTIITIPGSTLSGTINQIAYFDSSSSIASLTTATYPSLTELSYVKGVTSGIQSQIDGKQASGSYLVAADISNVKKGNFGATFDGQGAVITTNNYSEVQVPYAGTITDFYLHSITPSTGADLSCSSVFDIKRSGTSIIGAGNKPTLSSAATQAAAVSSWTSTSVAVGDVLSIYNVSNTGCVKELLSFNITKS